MALGIPSIAACIRGAPIRTEQPATARRERGAGRSHRRAGVSPRRGAASAADRSARVRCQQSLGRRRCAVVRELAVVARRAGIRAPRASICAWRARWANCHGSTRRCAKGACRTRRCGPSPAWQRRRPKPRCSTTRTAPPPPARDHLSRAALGAAAGRAIGRRGPRSADRDATRTRRRHGDDRGGAARRGSGPRVRGDRARSRADERYAPRGAIAHGRFRGTRERATSRSRGRVAVHVPGRAARRRSGPRARRGGAHDLARRAGDDRGHCATVPAIGCLADGTGVSPRRPRAAWPATAASCTSTRTPTVSRSRSAGARARSRPRSRERWRDGTLTCRFPGCTNRRFLDGHHLTHWIHGGATSLDNLCRLCPSHHRYVHERGISSSCATASRSSSIAAAASTPSHHASSLTARLASIRAANADLDLDATTGQCAWDGQPIAYGLVVDSLAHLAHAAAHADR
jgi:hypothetical protein